MSVIDRRKNVRLAHREFALQIIEDGNGNDVSETDLRMIQSQLKEKQKKLDKLDDEILGLISEEGEADDCVKEGKEAGQFRSKVQAAIIQIQGRLDDKLQRSVNGHAQLWLHLMRMRNDCFVRDGPSIRKKIERTFLDL
eukprot:gene3793-15079_t